MKTILLKLETEFFYDFVNDKHVLEHDLNKKITWEEYIKLIFAQSKIKRNLIKK